MEDGWTTVPEKAQFNNSYCKNAAKYMLDTVLLPTDVWSHLVLMATLRSYHYSQITDE